MRDLERVEAGRTWDRVLDPSSLSKVNNPYECDGTNVGVKYFDVVALEGLSPDGESMRNSALHMMEERRELPGQMRTWVVGSIAAQATRLAALEANSPPSGTMAGGRAFTARSDLRVHFITAPPRSQPRRPVGIRGPGRPPPPRLRRSA
jgi:hypothetical protein